jgi:hypothetical protein
MSLLITKGMQVFIIDVINANAVVEVKRVTAVNLGTAPADDIETTDLSEVSHRQYEKGLKSPSAGSINILYDAAEASHKLLKDLEESGETKMTMLAIAAADGTGTPTVDSNGDFNFPTTRSFMAIRGYISDFPVDIQLNSTVAVPVAIRRSGGLTISRKVVA